MMEALGVDSFYNNKWGAMGAEIVNPIGCSDCHDPETMNLHISRPALIEASNVRVKTSLKLLRRRCVHWYVHNVMWNIISKGMVSI